MLYSKDQSLRLALDETQALLHDAADFYRMSGVDRRAEDVECITTYMRLMYEKCLQGISLCNMALQRKEG